MSGIPGDLASDLRDVYLSARFELLRHLRRRRLAIALLLACLLPLLFYAIPPLFGTDYADTASSFASTNLGFLSLLITISAILFAGDSVAGEFEKRTGLILLPTPQRRNSIFTGKYLAGAAALFSVVSVYYLITALEIAGIYGMPEVSAELGKSFLLALIYSAAVLSLVTFLSSALKSGIMASLLGFFTLMMILPIIESVLMMVEVEPWFLITYPFDLITNVLGVESGFSGPGGGMAGAFEPDFYSGTLVMAGYAIILLLMSLFLANRRMME